MESGTESSLPQGTLAEELLRGPLPVLTALRYATGIALSLRILHAGGVAHGGVSPMSILMGPSGASLSRPEAGEHEARPRNDIAAFGAVLLEMLTGRQPCGPADIPTPPRPSLHSMVDDLRTWAVRLGWRCRSDEPYLSMQRVLTEVRVLTILARQSDRTSASRRRAAAAVPATPPLRESSSYTGTVRCPRCGGYEISASKPRTVFESLLAWRRIPIIRCHRCHFRYLIVCGALFSKGTAAE